MTPDIVPIKQCLISVSDKTGLSLFAKGLHALGIKLLSSGGTASVLRDSGVSVTDVSDYTGFPEMMDGRIKTLHPLIEGGILGLRDRHAQEAMSQGMEWIDLVVCNLYPFGDTIQKPETTLDEALEQIDIGGPTMIRSAAKNVDWVGVVVDPQDYDSILEELKTSNGLTALTRKQLSAKAFGYTAQYDTIIHNYLKKEPLSEDLSFTYNKFSSLRYGENPHQKAAAYSLPHALEPSVLTAKQHQGKQLSYNNIMDADAALCCVREFSDPTCVVVKHANPCGVATGKDSLDVYRRAFNADALSAFGGVIAMNRTCTLSIAQEISKVFVEIVLAPEFESEALEILKKKRDLRVLETGLVEPRKPDWEFRYVTGGILVQETDLQSPTEKDLQVVTDKHPKPDDIQTLLFAWKVLKYVKSNGILIARNNTTVGIGAGQVSRVDAVNIAVQKAGDGTHGSVLGSDAFFPFRDSIDVLAPAGISAIIQPGGSIRDQEVIKACNDHGIAMVFTGSRCFKH